MMPKDYNSTAEMHPEDRKAVVEGRAYAAEKGAAFCEQHKAELFALITEYGDSSAETALSNLRERFWMGSWEKKAAPPR